MLCTPFSQKALPSFLPTRLSPQLLLPICTAPWAGVTPTPSGLRRPPAQGPPLSPRAAPTAYGKVFLVRKAGGHDSGKLYAMKVLRKAALVQRAKTQEHTRTERSVLELVRQAPFLVTLHYAFQTDAKLHLILGKGRAGGLPSPGAHGGRSVCVGVLFPGGHCSPTSTPFPQTM